MPTEALSAKDATPVDMLMIAALLINRVDGYL